jgi:hypothetical protein
MKRIFTFFICYTIFGQLVAQNPTLIWKNDVFFRINDAQLSDASIDVLLNAIAVLQDNPQATIQLTGSTDLDGNITFNQNLSERRVNSVRRFLESKNVLSNKIISQAVGETNAQSATQNNEKALKRSVHLEVWNVVPVLQPLIVVKTPSPVFEPILLKDTLLKDPFKALFTKTVSPTQNFLIQNNRDTTIVGAAGTVVFIPKNAFKNNLTDATINFTLKENYDFASMIADNLTTQSNEELLQTGGMIFMEAKIGEEKLNLTKPIKIAFNSKQSQYSDMQIFEGNRNNNQSTNQSTNQNVSQNTSFSINWKPTNNMLIPSFIPREEFSKYFFSKKKGVYEIHYKTTKRKGKVEWYTFLPHISNTEKFSSFTFKQILDTVGFAEAGRKYYAREVFETTSLPVKKLLAYLEFWDPKREKFEANDYALNGRVLHRKLYKSLYVTNNIKRYKTFIKKENAVKIENTIRRQEREIQEAYRFLEKYNRQSFLKYLKTNNIDSITWSKSEQINAQINAQVDAQFKRDSAFNTEINGFFSSTKLGWINCDRFLNGSKNAPVLVNVSLKFKLDENNDKFVQHRNFLILPYYQSVMSAVYADSGLSFPNIPTNTEAKIVSIKKLGEKFYLSIKHIRVTKNMDPLTTDYVITGADKIKEQLSELKN